MTRSKLVKALIVSAAILSASTTSYAFNLAKLKPSNAKLIKDEGPALFFLTSTTKDGQAFDATVDFQMFAGTSATAPCSDLTLKEHFTDSVTIEPFDNMPMTSEDIVDMPGPGYSCIRADYGINGQVYSTGNITLQWNAANNVYTDASPKQITINFG